MHLTVLSGLKIIYNTQELNFSDKDQRDSSVTIKVHNSNFHMWLGKLFLLYNLNNAI